MNKRIVLLPIIIIDVIFIFIIQKYFFPHSYIKFKDWDKVDNLMIVAHPDDETLWGSSYLIKDKYLVVCITCGNKRVRDKEIKSALKISNDEVIFLKIPDKVHGKRSEWKKEKKRIKKELDYIMHKKEWNNIVTHNKQGEYGHIHHKMTNKIVTNIYEDNPVGNLKYFGKYYSKKKIKNKTDNNGLLDEYTYHKKLEMIDVYKSQRFIKKAFNQMFKYEDITDYKKK